MPTFIQSREMKGKQVNRTNWCVQSVRLALSITVSASHFALAAENESLVLDSPVREKIELLLKDYKPSKAQVRTIELHEINNKGNFGILTNYERRVSYARQDSGLWAVVSFGKFQSGAGTGSMQRLSLCGLVTLASAMTATTSNVATPVPIGKSFIPYGIQISVDQSQQQRVKALESDSNICAPVPGTQFSYRTETEVLNSTSSLLQLSLAAKRAEQFLCKVAPNATPANNISALLGGEFLSVACERTAGWGGKATREYAYIKDAGLYVLLRESSEYQTTQVQFKEATISE